MKKESAIINLVIWSVVAVALIAVLLVGVGGHYLNKFDIFDSIPFISLASDYGDDSSYTVGSGKVNKKDVNEIQIDWISGSVQVESTTGNQIEISETSSSNLTDKNKMRYKVENGVLKIHFCASSIRYNSRGTKKLIVYVPEDMNLDVFQISNVSADIDMKNIKTDLFDIESVSGAVRLENIECKDLDFETVSGNINFNGSASTIDGSTVSSNVKFDLSVCPTEINIEGVSGKIEVLIPENDGFTASIDKLSGRFSSDFNVTTNSDRYVYKTGINTFSFETLSGNVEINKNN